MQTLMHCSNKDLYYILTAPESELTVFLLAMKRALEESNSSKELESLSDRAILRDSVGGVTISKDGKVKRTM